MAVTQHRPTVEWQVDVFEDELAEEMTPRAVAEQAYHKILTSDMRPVLTVHMPDGTTHEVDLEEDDNG